MVHNPSWAANWFAASQEIPRISRNPNVHYRTHKRSLLFHWLINVSQRNVNEICRYYWDMEIVDYRFCVENLGFYFKFQKF